MKKVIKNKVYDTDKAHRLGEYEPDPCHSETFYRKRTGEFFLHECCGDEQIIPLTYQSAQAWAEEHLDGEDYIAIFGEPEEDNGSVTVLNIRISAAKMQKLRQAAGKRGVSLVKLVESMIDEL